MTATPRMQRNRSGGFRPRERAGICWSPFGGIALARERLELPAP